MECFYHPGIDAIGICTRCGRAICQQDAVEVQGKLICREDLTKGGATPKLGAAGKDPNTVFLLELVLGFFGLLGIGYMYVGRTNDGVIRLVLWLVYNLLAACMITLLLIYIVGIACVPFQLIIQIGVPLWSAYKLKNELMTQTTSQVV